MNKTLTDSAPDQSKIDKSDKTIKVSNSDFLSAIFSDNLSSEHPILVSFKGNPTNVPKHKWFGHPWTWTITSLTTMPNDANNYFSLARFRPNEAGEYRRKKSQFQGLYAVMLDDIGSKISLERLTLPPSWFLETSPGITKRATYWLNQLTIAKQQTN